MGDRLPSIEYLEHMPLLRHLRHATAHPSSDTPKNPVIITKANLLPDAFHAHIPDPPQPRW
jgi:hypothetical protein